MKATGATSIAALVATLSAAAEVDVSQTNLDGQDLRPADAPYRLHSNAIDAASVFSIDVSADGSVEVCEG